MSTQNDDLNSLLADCRIFPLQKTEYVGDVNDLGYNFCSDSFILKAIILEKTSQNEPHPDLSWHNRL